jgi:hypothetical protein
MSLLSPNPGIFNFWLHTLSVTSSAQSIMDRLYGYDEAKLEGIRASKLWTIDPRYFKRVKISPSAAVKVRPTIKSVAY